MRYALSALFVSLALLGLVCAEPAAADEPLPPDSVVLTLAAEDWVDTATARVRVAVDSAMEADAVAAARGRIKATLAKLLPEADWHITEFRRDRDASGLERWHLEAEARVPETALDGLYDRAMAASRPGEQVSVAGIDFVPTLAEREKTFAGLRATVYGEVKDELGRLNATYKDRSFRVRTIDFTGQAVPAPRPYARAMAAEAPPVGAAPSEAAPIGVAEKVHVTATVVLAAEPPGRDKDARDKD
jgi:hypothetical protein